MINFHKNKKRYNFRQSNIKDIEDGLFQYFLNFLLTKLIEFN